MADSNASLIPKNTQRIQKRVRTTYRIYLLSYLSYVFFFGTMIAVIGTFFYAIQIEKGLENVKADLQTARQAFSEDDIQGVREMEKRLLIANQLLNQMAAPSRIFSEVEKIVADNIKFIRFSYESLPNQQATISLTGKAEDFNQILYQRDLMNSSLLFESTPDIQFDYSGSAVDEEATTAGEATPVAADEEATLTFTVSNEISTSQILYQPVDQSNANVVTEVRSTETSTVVPTQTDTISTESAVTEINPDNT